MLRLKQLDVLFLRAERTIALLDRCRAKNQTSELERLQRAWQAGRRSAPRFEYAPAPQLAELRRVLEAAARGCDEAGAWGQLYAERAEELDREAALVEALGSADFAPRAAARFAVGDGPHDRQAEAWASAWAESGQPPKPEATGAPSDDKRDPASLLSAMQRAIGELRLPFRVIVDKGLWCAAATGAGIVVVRGGARYTRRAVARIVLHEIEGHALPRHRAASERCGLFACASAGGSDDEEGRALLLERRHGCLDERRRCELGRRHLASLSVRRGASWRDTVELLSALGTTLDKAIEIASRAHRGGGLGRELVYLPALARVEAALEEDPELEQWLSRGRVSVASARRLRELGPPPEGLQPPRAA